MESVPGDLKGGVATDTAGRASGVSEDLWAVNGGVGDDLFVDEFLDFSNGYSETEEQPPSAEEPPPEKEQGVGTVCSVSQERDTEPPESGGFAGKDGFGSLHESELSVQAEGLESLEWLSHFVEDSFSDYSLTGKFPIKVAEDGSEPTVPAPSPCFTTPVQTKARTKRARTGVRVWPVLSSSFTESSATSSSSSTSSTTTTSFSPSSLSLIHTLSDNSSLLKPSAKKQKKKPADSGGGGVTLPRRCSHCGVTKTPQWRAGPLGSKTLCNACGVQFKSGRLLPEYRPACSPTFSSELHSNNHRKVLEMRRKKEGETPDAGSEFLKSCQIY